MKEKEIERLKKKVSQLQGDAEFLRKMVVALQMKQARVRSRVVLLKEMVLERKRHESLLPLINEIIEELDKIT